MYNNKIIFVFSSCFLCDFQQVLKYIKTIMSDLNVKKFGVVDFSPDKCKHYKLFKLRLKLDWEAKISFREQLKNRQPVQISLEC